MPLYGLILLVLLGIALLLVEFLIVPGVTVAGISGFLCMVYAIYSAYTNFDTSTGNYLLLATVFANIVTLYFAFRAKTWKRLGLGTEIESKNITFEQDLIKAGDSGKAITRLAPVGKVLVNDIACEAKTQGEFMDPHTEIIVIKINNNQLLVKPKINK